jgi:hypothetical protein
VKAALALALALALPGLVHAGAPTPAAWAPYDATNAVNALAFSRDGSTAAAALAPNSAPTPGAVPAVATSDLAILDAAHGFVTNGTTNGACPPPPPGPAPAAPCATYPLGKSFVATSLDGTTVAALGLVATASNAVGGVLGGTPGESLQLSYQRVTSGGSWHDARSFVNVSRIVSGNATGLAVSNDGTRVVVTTDDEDTFSVLGFVFDGSQLQAQFSDTRGGHAYALATTPNLEIVTVATQIPEANNQTHGALYSYSFTTGSLASTLYDRSVNGSALVSAAVTSDGRLFAGDMRGRLLYGTPSNDLAPVLLPGASANVTPMVVSTDGGRLALAEGAQVVLVDTSGATPNVLWNATLPGNVATLSANHTGGLVVAAVNGSAGGVFAFGDNDSTLLWTIPGAAAAAALDDAGRAVAYAQNSHVVIATVPRAISFELPGGGKASQSLPVKPQGTTSFDAVVRNPGAALERVTFTGPRDTDVSVVASPSSVVVAPGQAANVTLLVTAGKTFTGRHAFNVTAVSQTSGVMDNVTLSMLIQTSSVVSLTLNGSTEVTVAAGVKTDLLLGVVNNGTRDAAVGLRAIQQPSVGDLWNVTLDPTTFTLAPNTITTVRASVTAPESATNGTSDTVTFIMQGPDVSDQVTVTFRINPTFGIDVEPVGSATKFVEPGKIAYYNVSVTNTGSLPRDFQAFVQPSASGGKNWPVEMFTDPFLLGPGQQRVLPVQVFAPADAAPNDQASVFIVAHEIPAFATDNQTTQGNVTLHAIAIPPKPTTTTPVNPIPAVGPVAALGVLALIAAALRQRRRPQ